MRKSALVCNTIPEVQDCIFELFLEPSPTTQLIITKVTRSDNDRPAWMVEVS